jgi:hypothetical protein
VFRFFRAPLHGKQLHGSDFRFHSVPEWEADKTHVSVLIGPQSQSVPRVTVQVGGFEEAGSGHEDSGHNILNAGCLAGFVSAQVTLSSQCPCGYGRYVKVHIHTYGQHMNVYFAGALEGKR